LAIQPGIIFEKLNSHEAIHLKRLFALGIITLGAITAAMRNEAHTAHGKQLSKILAGRLKEQGWTYKHPLTKPLLKDAHRIRRLAWGQEDA